MAEIDLRDAYFVSIHPAHQKYLRFAVGNLHYQYVALPFGFLASSRVFSKCVVVIAAHLQLQGIQIFQYLDDWLLLASLERFLHDHLQRTLQLLSTLSLVVNLEKSCLTPVR